MKVTSNAEDPWGRSFAWVRHAYTYIGSTTGEDSLARESFNGYNDVSVG